MVDCGADWKGEVAKIAPHTIVITHPHPDHAWGLQEGAPCSVHATASAREDMRGYPIRVRQVIEPRTAVMIKGIRSEAFPVEHSTRCPTVGFRVKAGRAEII